MIRLFARLIAGCLFACASPVYAQGVIQQVGPVVPGDIAAWWQNGQVYDGGRVNVSTGTLPVNSGSCAVTTQVGGATAGSFHASGACAGGTYVLTLSTGAPNGWACFASDMTTPADTVKQTASTATTVTFTATTASADVIVFSCMGF